MKETVEELRQRVLTELRSTKPKKLSKTIGCRVTILTLFLITFTLFAYNSPFAFAFLGIAIGVPLGNYFFERSHYKWKKPRKPLC